VEIEFFHLFPKPPVFFFTDGKCLHWLSFLMFFP
jgi:hypothetical protein